MSSISRTEHKYCLSQSVDVEFLTGIKPPPQKKAKLSETDARCKKEKRKRELQKTWKDKRVVPLNVWVFLPGNQGFIRATKFTALVAWLLKWGQPAFIFNFEHCDTNISTSNRRLLLAVTRKPPVYCSQFTF